jgi:hypothetical protein
MPFDFITRIIFDEELIGLIISVLGDSDFIMNELGKTALCEGIGGIPVGYEGAGSGEHYQLMCTVNGACGCGALTRGRK